MNRPAIPRAVGDPPRLGFLHVGPARHGVTRFGWELQRAMGPLATVRAIDARAPEGIDLAATATALATAGCVDAWVLQFTDHVWGRSPETAVATAGAVLDRLAPAPVVVAFHDVPAEVGAGGDTAERRTRRAAAYASLAGRVRPVVGSEHERRRLHACGHDGRIDVVRLPVADERAAAPSDRAGHGPRSHGTVAVLGFVYPHKGQLDVVQACAGVGPGVRFVNLGGASPGHDDLVEELRRTAARLGVGCDITGWIDDAELPAALAAADVPVVAHRDVSASASLARWLAAGRRPLVADGPYAAELDAAAPGLITRYCARTPGALAGAITAARHEPGLTWHDGVPAAWSPAAAARRYLEVAAR